jgi:hypothetical protein
MQEMAGPALPPWEAIVEDAYRRGDPLRSIVRYSGVGAEEVCSRLMASHAQDDDLIRTRALRERTRAAWAELEKHGMRVLRLFESGISEEDVPKVLRALADSSIEEDIAADLLRTLGAPDMIVADRNAPEGPRLSDKLSLLYFTGRHHQVVADYELALGKMSLAAVQEMRDLLYKGFPYRRTAEILATIETTALAIRADPTWSLTPAEYEAAAKEFHRRNGKVSVADDRPWPVPVQLLRSRLGKGFWEDALRVVGLAAPTDDHYFSEADCFEALDRFTDTDLDLEVVGYDTWVTGEIAMSRERPSAIALIRQYGSWEEALRQILPEDDQAEDCEPDDHTYHWGFPFGMEDASFAAHEEKQRKEGGPVAPPG